ncbi:aconitate hydratase [Leptothermofonsia sichuanensis E412]|uniref:aconitate hydratase n=1 Tax=Leptothermofonsia sichuanensis TaxID=2917832 RepID=UPI001CA67D79|nr:aconitate hydratase [Leptothermofonsia sichuanensis]QZZ20882.1 aconitate hydratase [Leptothermofonsia sichuanensis E412]
MPTPHSLFDTLQEFSTGTGQTAHFYSLPQLERAGVGAIAQLPVSLRIVLESVLRHHDGRRITESDIRTLANWQPQAERTTEIPFIVARILLQDFTGVPVLVDLAAMRSAAARMGYDPAIVEPLVPVDLVVDHSIQVDFSAIPNALQLNMEMEFRRNEARYRFLKWGMQAFNGFAIVPPGIGIVHQVNLEYLARGVLESEGIYYPDSLVGTDSHTTMINGLGIVGWGVGGIEAEAGMLGQPVYFLTPDVVGVHLSGALQPGVTATDLVLRLTELLRQAGVVGKFVEFYGEGAASLSVPDRATISNMSPEYGATMGFFPVDEESCRYLRATGRSQTRVDTFRAYFQAQGLFGMPQPGEIQYSQTLELDLATVAPSVAGPKRPQDRIPLAQLKQTFQDLLQRSVQENGYQKTPAEQQQTVTVTMGNSSHPLPGGGAQDPERVPSGDALRSDRDTAVLTEVEMIQNRPTPDPVAELPRGAFPQTQVTLGHGRVVIAAITSCTNTSNPTVMLAAGLLAKKAVERGMTLPAYVKTSLAPGSRVVTDYLTRTGLQSYLDQLGFQTVGYGCTTCIGNSGPLEPHLEAAITNHDLVVASVLSGNRNFEARVHQSVKANFLMSPPLVIAFALAGRVDIDLTQEPLGTDRQGKAVYLRDLWPTSEEISHLLSAALDPATFQRLYASFTEQNPLWAEIPSRSGKVYEWDASSTYIQEPPYFEGFSTELEPVREIRGARAIALFGDSVTTDHISPAGAIKPSSPAGLYLQAQGVAPADFNSYGSRRGNHQVMVRGTFANVQIKNWMVPGVEGGFTLHQPGGEPMTIYDAALRYQSEGTPLLIFAGQEYGTGSSRDWAAKGTKLLGIRAVIAQSFERIHRSNLVGMGVVPCQFLPGTSWQSLAIDGTEQFDLMGLEQGMTPLQTVSLVIHRATGESQTVPLILRIDTTTEVDYFRHGGILPYVLGQLLQSTH